MLHVTFLLMMPVAVTLAVYWLEAPFATLLLEGVTATVVIELAVSVNRIAFANGLAENVFQT